LFTLKVDLGTVQLDIAVDTLDALVSAGIDPNPLKTGLAAAVQAAQLTWVGVAEAPGSSAPAEGAPAADPWMTAGPTPQSQAAPPVQQVGQQSYAPQNMPQGASGGQQSLTLQTGKGPQFWTLGIPGAPYCQCGVSAGQVRAKGGNGRDYTAWRCAKGSGDDWRTKCEFNQWV
jgi:hypothetical protein